MTESLPRHRMLRAAGLAAASVFIVALACDVPPPTEPVPPSEAEAVVMRATGGRITSIESPEPLFVVDGVIVSGNTAWITELDIESIEVVKGATARTLYGERARHGLVVITTASGDAARVVEIREVPSRARLEQKVALDRSAREREVAQVAELLAKRRADGSVETEVVLPSKQGAGVLRRVDAAQAAEIEAREQAVRRAVVVVPLMKDRAAQEAAEVARRQAVELEAVARVKVPLRVVELEAARAQLVERDKVASVEARVEAVRAAEVAATIESTRPEDVTVVLREAERRPSIVRRSDSTGPLPIYVVDGVVLGPGRLNFDALDIESIEVVKGAAAEKLYGTRGRNGVIRITTKK